MAATAGSLTSVTSLRSSSLAAPIACGSCLAVGAAYVAAADPSEGGGLIPCPFRALTGLWCPGCGLTRATHHLFRGDLTQALRYHLFVIVVLATIVLAWSAWMLRAAGRRPRRAWPRWVQPALVAAASITLVVFAVVRNLPAVGGLRG